jgi:hypothetical protein
MSAPSHSGFARTLLELCHLMMHDVLGDYRPERHYMRGPGPKCREKQRTQTTQRQLPVGLTDLIRVAA